MENPSGPERPLPEDHLDPELSLPPGLRFARGMGIFLIVLCTFFLVQTAVFIAYCRQMTPALKDLALPDLLASPELMAAMRTYSTHGDAVASASLWSGIAGLAMLLLLCRQWVGPHLARFLGLRAPGHKALWRWLGIFLAVAGVLEVVGYLLPQWFTTDYMTQVVDSSTKPWLLLLGIGILPAVFEEAMLRGLFFGTLRQVTDEHMGVAITAGAFALMHMQYTIPIMLMVLVLGVVLGYARSRSGSLWLPIGLHMLNNLVSLLLAYQA